MEKDIAIAQRDVAHASIAAASDRADAAVKDRMDAEDRAHAFFLEKTDLEKALDDTTSTLHISKTKGWLD